MEEKPEKRRIKSVSQAITLITTMMEIDEPVTVSELAERLDRSVASTYTYLMTLKDHGVVSEENKKYVLGPRLIMVGSYVKHSQNIYQAGRGEINRLVQKTGETGHIAIRHGNHIISIYEQYGEDAREINRHEGKRERQQYFHCTAAGKAYLSTLSKSEIREIIDDTGLPKVTPKTITEREELFEAIKRARERGYAIQEEEQIIGMRAVGAPVRNHHGEPVGTISVSVPQHRRSDEWFDNELPTLVQGAANVIEMRYSNE